MLHAQDYPEVNPTAQYITVEGEELEEAGDGQSAPLQARFFANPSNVGDYTARYEWKVWKQENNKDLLLHRFEQDIDYTFTSSGTFKIQLYATFVLGNDTIVYPAEGEENPFIVSISESNLEFPNAISPNGDGYNDVLKAKDGYRSIVSFQAAIFNRWGQRLYSWNKLDGGWDGKRNGRVVPDGAYFLVVAAKGADGRKYNIRKTISVISGYRSERGVSDGGE